MWNRRSIMTHTAAAAGALGLSPSAFAADPKKAALTPAELKQLVGKATRLSVLSDRITRCQAQRSLQVLTPRAEKLLNDTKDEVRRGLTEIASASVSDSTKTLLTKATGTYETFLKHSAALDIKNAKALGDFAVEADVVGDHMDAVVDSLVKEMGQSVAAVLSQTADLQRLTQHNAVHFLMARVGVNEAEQLKEVTEGRQHFNEKLKAVQSASLKTPAIEAQLQLLGPQWMLMSSALAQAGNDPKMLENISTTSERLLEVTTSLYALYDAALKA